MNDAMLSIVKKGCPKDCLLVRARLKGDIERVFPGAEITESDVTDYRFRAVIKASDIAAVVARQIMGIDYANFKGSVKDHARHDAYMGVWSAMYRAQNEERRSERFDRVQAPALFDLGATGRKRR